MGGCLSYRVKLVHDQDTLFQNVTHFSFKSLKKATSNFSTSSKFRVDGSSISYKGSLKDGSLVIVRVFNTLSKVTPDLASMIKVMSGIRHQNVVELIGYCMEDGHRIFVHEFVGDYSLDQLLFSHPRGRDVVLDWPSRVSICHGIARALDYLHNGISPRVLLRNVKPYNILVDCSFNPKIMGFDTSCLLEDGESHHSGPVVGTLGYLDAEYSRTGRSSEKIDVYAFGITLLELIHEDELTRFVNVALSCVQSPSELRPSMYVVRVMLSGGYDFSNVVLNRPQIRTIPMDPLQQSSVDELSSIYMRIRSRSCAWEIRDISTEDISLNKEDTSSTNVTRFTFESLKKATNDFNHSSEMRWIGFSRSYKGTLYDGSEIVVKVYSTEDIDINFSSMIRIMSVVKHENVVKLLGYCIEDDHRMLVHEFAGDYSLD